MPFSPAAIIAELSTKAECDQFDAFLVKDHAQATFQLSNLGYTLTNYGSPAARNSEIKSLTKKIADAVAELAPLPDGPDKLQKKAAMQRDELRLTSLQTKTYTQGGDDKASKMHESNGYDNRIARANVLRPLVAIRKDELQS